MGVWNQWNRMVEWTTGMEYWNDWDKIFVFARNLKHYMDQVDRYYMTNYASTMLGTADHVGLTFISCNP